MKTFCAWCGALIKDGNLFAGGLVSHGICPDCAAMFDVTPEETIPKHGFPSLTNPIVFNKIL